MQPETSASDQNTGLCYAVTDDGLRLPVIDVSHPAFAIQLSEAEVDALLQEHLKTLRKQGRFSVFLQQRVFMPLVKNQSILMRGLMDASGTFLSGVNTYILKLGADNLDSSYASQIDRQIAASLPTLSVRLRLQDLVHMLADGLTPALEHKPGRPLHLLNIGGGPAIDSLDALILVRKRRPALIAGRQIFVHCLDMDEAGPHFGARALTALQAEGAPLHDLDVDFEPVKYDWSHPDDIRALAATFGEGPSVMGASSEGALFEYGSDEEVSGNLKALHEVMPDDAVVTGSVTRADEVGRLLNSTSNAALRLRGMQAFTRLANQAGWDVATIIDRPMNHDVCLKKISR